RSEGDELAFGVARVVQRLVLDATRRRAVAGDRDDLVVLLLQVARGRTAERRRDRGRRVTGAEDVVLRLLAGEEARGPALRADAGEGLVPPGQDLVRVPLV